METKERQTMDPAFNKVRMLFAAKIGEAYDAFVDDVESNWDAYFQAHGKLILSRKDIISLRSLNDSARTRASQKVIAAIKDYFASCVETLSKKFDVIIKKELWPELALRFGKSKADIEVMWEKTVLEMVMSRGIVDWFYTSEGWAAIVFKATVAQLFQGPVLADPWFPRQHMIMLLSVIHFTKLIINPADLFLFCKKSCVEYLLHEKESVLDGFKKEFDELLQRLCERMDANERMENGSFSKPSVNAGQQERQLKKEKA